jgi:hypothetical protein
LPDGTVTPDAREELSWADPSVVSSPTMSKDISPGTSFSLSLEPFLGFFDGCWPMVVELVADGEPGRGDCDRDLFNLDVNTERNGASLDIM